MGNDFEVLSELAKNALPFGLVLIAISLGLLMYRKGILRRITRGGRGMLRLIVVLIVLFPIGAAIWMVYRFKQTSGIAAGNDVVLILGGVLLSASWAFFCRRVLWRRREKCGELEQHSSK